MHLKYCKILEIGNSRPKKLHSRKKNLPKVVKSKMWLKNVVMFGKCSLTKSANFLIIVLRAEIATTFGSKMVAISARNTIVRKFTNFVRLHLPYFTRFRDQILKFYYILKVLFGNFIFFAWICLDQKLVYKGNCLLIPVI